MGVRICNPCSQNRENEEIIFSNRYKKHDKTFTFDDSSKLNSSNIKNNTKYNINLSDLELSKAKLELESSIIQKGGTFQNISIIKILEEINPTANKINIPKEILNNYSITSIQQPMIKFPDGEIYEGGWNLNNQRNGYGISVDKEGNVFKGIWENDNFGNYGAFIDKNGNYYIGELENGKAKGKGEMFINKKMKYKGEFKDDFPYGKGILENYRDNYIYNGNIINGIKNGYGELKFEEGTIYKGEFKEDKFHGKGKIIFSNGREYEGEFKNNKMDGDGIFIWEDGKKYIGKYIDNIKQGYGKLSWNENKYYEGEWFNNKPHGTGIYYFNGKLLKGKFRFGKIISKTDG